VRILLAAFILTASVVLPRASSAENWTPARPAERIVEPSLVSKLPALFRTLGIVVIPSAHAAECTSEGETCTSNEQCCPGLECVGGPPTTCVEEE
jgi:hypothetical protein